MNTFYDLLLNKALLYILSLNEKDCNVNVNCNVVPISGGGRPFRQLRSSPRIPNGFVLQEEDSTVEAEEKALRVLCGSHH